MNDKLREALAIVEKYGMKGDVIYKEIEALAASKQEPQLLQKSFDELAAERRASKTEPQAQAEPEEIQRLEAHCISYREAIAKKDAALKVCVEALGTCRIMSKDNDGNYTIEATPKIITSAIKQAKDSLE